MDEHRVRASDDDRQQVVDVLREQTTIGRLSLEEFEERMGAAYSVRTWAELRSLACDLPVELVFDGAPSAQPERIGFRKTGAAATRGLASAGTRVPSRLRVVLLFAVLLYMSFALEWGPQWTGFVMWLLVPGLALWAGKRAARAASRRRAAGLAHLTSPPT